MERGESEKMWGLRWPRYKLSYLKNDVKYPQDVISYFIFLKGKVFLHNNILFAVRGESIISTYLHAKLPKKCAVPHVVIFYILTVPLGVITIDML